MARPKKNQSAETDAAKMRDVEAYTHDDKKRTNNPPVGMAQHDKAEERVKTYQFDPHLDPTLQWAGKAEGTSFDVPTSSIHIHEAIKPLSIISRVMKEYSDALEGQLEGQQSMFPAETPAERMRRRKESIEFYQHGVDWTNRLIAGDSLVIMNSLLEKEGMAGQVQMVYIDPPYGIKYGSNFQPFVDKRDVKDKKDEDLTQEPEMIKAFRDTWELGIHSYLTYLRDRLLLARELLADSGSVFVQISDENVHHIKELCDEVFGTQNYLNIIPFVKTSGVTTKFLASRVDFIIWYAKNKDCCKYRTLYLPKSYEDGTADTYTWLDLPDGTRRGMTKEERINRALIPDGAKIYKADNITSQGNPLIPFEFNGKIYTQAWKTNIDGLSNLAKMKRLHVAANSLQYVRYLDDFPVVPITQLWTDTGTGSFTEDKRYVVQTAIKVIQRCMLMTTDPGDLVLDITCGSGTTAYVAEQWGRRWITCDTSRVAITLAKQRLMTATFDYYKLAHEEQGVGSGFVYKTVPHITLKSIANNEPPATETLYDQPEIDKTKIRITGPFTVEALPAPVVKPLDSRMVALAMDEAETLRPSPKLIIFAAFQFDPEAAKDIDETNWPGVTLLKAQMNTDLMTEDLKKKRSSDQSFWLVGQPDVELIPDKRSKTKFKVRVNGFDYYDVTKGTVESGSTSRIAMWMLDTDYDGMCIEPKQVFFPMGGKKDGWTKLAKTLRAEIDMELIEKYAGNESLWFNAQPNTQIAVKIIDDRGIESLKVIRIGDE